MTDVSKAIEAAQLKGKAALEPTVEPKDTRKGFFVDTHPYVFKFKGKELKPNKKQQYEFTSEAEKEALMHFAAKGYILFKE